MGIWNQIRSMNPLKRKKNMKQEELTMATQDEANEVKKFQWIKGDNFGDVVEVSTEDTEFYYFTNGSQIYKSIHREFLMPVQGAELPLPVANETPTIVRIPTAHVASTPQETKAANETPLEKLILKLSQKNVESINVKLGINIPKREVVEMLIENSDESRDEILESITKMAVAQITIDKLQDFITEEVNSHLNKYYNE
jgi:hypothetical protein